MASSTIPAAKIIHGVIEWSSQTITGTNNYTELLTSTITTNTVFSQMIPGIQYRLLCLTPVVLSTVGAFVLWIKSDVWYNSNSTSLQVRARSLTGSNLTATLNMYVLAIPQPLIKG